MEFLNDTTMLVAEELEALEGIYGDEIASKENGSNRVVKVSYRCSQFSATFHLPTDYPSLGSKVAFELSVNNIPLKNLVLERVNEYIDSNSDCEEGILFQLIELIKDTIGDCCLTDTVVTEVNGRHAMVVSADGATDAPGEVDATAVQRSVVLQMPFEDVECYNRIGVMIAHGVLVTERRSVFQAHCCVVNSMAEVEMFRHIVLSDKKVSSATHNIFAYRFVTNTTPPVWHHDNDDDGETAAGSRLAELLRLLPVQQCAVIVTRWYGGIQLGPDRFKLINNTARNLLDECGFIEQKSGALRKHSKSSKLKR
jgi:hypothetical protein